MQKVNRGTLVSAFIFFSSAAINNLKKYYKQELGPLDCKTHLLDQVIFFSSFVEGRLVNNPKTKGSPSLK